MANSRKDTRLTLIQAALELFVSQGIANTSTRQIANLAEVNEVTLFRKFGNKYGLLQAVVEESEPFVVLGTQLEAHLQTTGDRRQDLRQYATVFLEAIASVQAFSCSLVGEAEHYPPDLKKQVGHKLGLANQKLAQFLKSGNVNSRLSDEAYAGLIHHMLIGYSVVDAMSQSQKPWKTPIDYIDTLLTFVEDYFWQASVSEHLLADRESEQNSSTMTVPIIDLPASVVHSLLQQARKTGVRDYALAYVLFGAGLSFQEIALLLKEHQLCDARQHILQVKTAEGLRQVPLNQWILGKRYGSYTNNPLTKWIKSRKDQSPYLFCEENLDPITPASMLEHWKQWCSMLPDPSAYDILQAQQTWRVEMLMKGMSVENLSILTGLTIHELEPYAQRAKEKTALEQAALLDRK